MPYFHKDPEGAARYLETGTGEAFPIVGEGDGRRFRRRRRVVFATFGALVVGVVLFVSSWQSGVSTAPGGVGTGADRVAEEEMEAFKFHHKRTLKVDKELVQARGVYNQQVALAFAALTKVSYCGPLPGIYSAVALTCSILGVPGTTSVCERANFKVIPGSVAALQASDMSAPDAEFAFMAKVAPGDIEDRDPTTASGVLLAFRGSIDNLANGVRDKETKLRPAGDKCEGCKLHTGYNTVYELLSSQITTYLKLWNCVPKDEENAPADENGFPKMPIPPCWIYVTGRGSGAAVAQIAMLDLSFRGYRIGVSYLFGSPMVGDDKFAASMNAQFKFGGQGPVYQVVEGKESAVRWPFDKGYTQWGVQAYYANTTETEPTVICYSWDPLCGVNTVPKEELTHWHACDSALAPENNFCDFGEDFTGACYGGLSFEIQDTARAVMKVLTGQAQEERKQKFMLAVAEAEWAQMTYASKQLAEQPLGEAKHPWATPALPQPADKAAAKWHPSQADGERAKALAEKKKNGASFSRSDPRHYFSMDTLRAMAMLSKIAYCGASPGLENTVVSTCSGEEGSLCRLAGFGMVPRSVVPQSVPYAQNTDAVFFYTALVRRTSKEYAEAPYFMHSEACVVVFRGSANAEDQEISKDLVQDSANDTKCKGCTISRGLNQLWDREIEKRLIPALNASGCSARQRRTKTDKVIIMGHSLGGTLATLAVYKLDKLGFDVQLSWSLEGGRIGNRALMNYMGNDMFAFSRKVPMWHVMNENDGMARWPKQLGGKPAGRSMYQIHFEDGKVYPNVCSTREDAAPTGRCGILDDWENLAFTPLSKAQCNLPYAPQGSMCMVVGRPRSVPYAMAYQCSVGGRMHK